RSGGGGGIALLVLLGEEAREILGLPLLLHVAELDAVLRALGAREGRNDFREVQRQSIRERRLQLFIAEQTLSLAVRLDERDLVLGAAGEAQIVERAPVDGEEADGV